jgi:MFS family permease
VTRVLCRDGRFLFLTRFVRLFAYGFLSVVLVLYLSAVGLSDERIGLLLMLTLLGDVAVSLWVTTQADRVGRRRMLMVGAAMMLLAAVVFASTSSFWLLLLAATVGVISPSGNEVGPFLAIEQAALAQLVPAGRRTGVLAWYNLAGSLATALGALAGGATAQVLQGIGWVEADSYRPIVVAYGACGLLLGLVFACLSAAVEVAPQHHGEAAKSSRWGLHRSRGTVLRLSALFGLDAFGGGFVIQSAVAWWFHSRYGSPPATIGAVFFGANTLAGFSALPATALAHRIGLVKTMVFTHIPSNALLVLVPLMPNETLAAIVLLLRFSISQMDVPTRQSYTLAVIAPEERSAAAGITGVARSVGASFSPFLATVMFGSVAWASLPFFLAGGVKIVYDLLLYRLFVAVRPPEENPP